MSDKEKFEALIEDLKALIEDLVKLTEVIGTTTSQQLIIEYEIEIINDEASLEVIAAATTRSGDDDTVSSAARRQLNLIQERTAITQGMLGLDDSVSVTSSTKQVLLEDGTNPVDQDPVGEDSGAEQPIGIQRVPDEQWRNVKTKQGFLPWWADSLVSTSSSFDHWRRQT